MIDSLWADYPTRRRSMLCVQHAVQIFIKWHTIRRSHYSWTTKRLFISLTVDVWWTILSSSDIKFSLDFLLDKDYVHHRSRHCSYHWQGCSLRSVTERSTSPQHELETVCHHMWRHQALSDHSSLNSKPICFLPRERWLARLHVARQVSQAATRTCSWPDGMWQCSVSFNGVIAETLLLPPPSPTTF